MNQEVKRKWVGMLRSGDFVQGMGTLRQKTDNGYMHCCLGVLCELYSQEVGNILFKEDGEFGGSWNDLPYDVAVWAGIPIQTTLKYGTSSNNSLIHLNDVIYLSFQEIATLIEEQL
jgi:hypothetical protein